MLPLKMMLQILLCVGMYYSFKTAYYYGLVTQTFLLLPNFDGVLRWGTWTLLTLSLGIGCVVGFWMTIRGKPLKESQRAT